MDKMINGILWTMLALMPSPPLAAQSLESELKSESVTTLAEDARHFGNASRGAIVFHQPQLGCIRCHVSDKQNHQLGPDLTSFSAPASDQHLIDSVLNPSSVIRDGYSPIHLTTSEEEEISGLFVSQSKTEITIRNMAQNYRRSTYSKSDLTQIEMGTDSFMPTGLVNALANRQQFLDLILYLMEIRDGGKARALQLAPPPSLFAERPLPDYENELDHAGIIGDLDSEAFQRGKRIYHQLCINCHGTHNEAGSLPTSLKFAGGVFKSGIDPLSMYQTLTQGFGMMAAQTWMVPTQKYDVIHYIREAYLKEHNPSQYFSIDTAYLNQLPKGNKRGPEPSEITPWKQMNYGPNLVMTLEIGDDAGNFAYKGNVVRLDAGPGGVSQGRYWMVYDYDTLRVAAAWSGDQFCDWNGINFNGRHAIHPRLVGDLHLQNLTGPGWGRPGDGSFEDVRLVGRDERIYGPLPREWAHYKGMYYYGSQTIIQYTVGETEVLEMPNVLTDTPQPVFIRSFNIGKRDRQMKLQVAQHPPNSSVLSLRNGMVILSQSNDNGRVTVAGIVGNAPGVQWSAESGNLRLTIPAGNQELRFKLWFASIPKTEDALVLQQSIVIEDPQEDLKAFTHGGPSRWPEILTAEAEIGETEGPFAVDVLKRPVDNPWFCRMRLTGFDFLPGGDQMIVSAWEGSIWLVSGLKQLENAVGKKGTVPITWRRIASGLFQPLGVKYLNGKTYVICRDQLAVLHDLNGDGEIDYFENFNNDHQVTDHFHEFAMGLQADKEGNFYYAKSARHAKTALVPHHGTLLRISKDGSRTDILAKGFRAANGVCLNPDGTFIVTDQEGHWNPKNRINWVKEGGFYGNMYGYHDITDSSDEAMERPLCWITNAFDRSPGELLWIDSNKWGSLSGKLLNLSYGYGKVYIVPHEEINGQKQGGMCAFPIERFPTGVMRGRFHPDDGQLYLCGMFAWAGNQTQPGGLYRLRYTGKPVHLPTELKATRKGMTLKFSGELDRNSAIDPGNYQVKTWDLKRTRNYGSEHYNEKDLIVASVTLDNDGKTVHLNLPGITPTWSMEINYDILSKQGLPIEGSIHNTIHNLSE